MNKEEILIKLKSLSELYSWKELIFINNEKYNNINHVKEINLHTPITVTKRKKKINKSVDLSKSIELFDDSNFFQSYLNDSIDYGESSKINKENVSDFFDKLNGTIVSDDNESLDYQYNDNDSLDDFIEDDLKNDSSTIDFSSYYDINSDSNVSNNYESEDYESEDERKSEKNYLNQSLVSNNMSYRKFSMNREKLSIESFKVINKIAFQNRFPNDLSIVWSKRLVTTAGRAKLTMNSNGERTSVIELSTKVCDDEERLRSVLLHEMCHSAAWLFDGISKPPHGKPFQKWCKHVSNYLPDLTVTTCHNYDIYKPHQWQCTNNECGKTHSRHSKKGIDISKNLCGFCSIGQLQYQGSFSRDGQIRNEKKVSAFRFKYYSRLT